MFLGMQCGLLSCSWVPFAECGRVETTWQVGLEKVHEGCVSRGRGSDVCATAHQVSKP